MPQIVNPRVAQPLPIGLAAEGHRRFVFIFALVCLASGCTAVGRHGPADADVVAARHLSRQGIAALDRGDLRSAEAQFAAALTKCPDHAEARSELATCLWKRGATRDAVEQLSTALEQSNSPDADLIIRLAYMRMALGDLEAASRLAARALRTTPDSAAAWQLQGTIAQQQRQWPAALDSFYRALALQPNNVEIQFALAGVHSRLGQPQRALAMLNRLEHQLAPDPAPQQLLVLKGIALQKLGRLDDAIATLQLASQRERPSGEIYLLLAEAQAATGRISEARQSLARAEPILPATSAERLKRLSGRLGGQLASQPDGDRRGDVLR